MPRVISFLVLLAIVLLVGAIFYRVMAPFIVPLFLACVLLVVFQPLHVRIRERLPNYPRIAALITTVLIVLAVVLPLVWVGWNAVRELQALLWPTGLEIELVAEEPLVPVDDVPPEEAPGLTAWLHEVAFDLRNIVAGFTGIHVEDETMKSIVAAIPGIAGSFAVAVLRQTVIILVGLLIIVIALYYFLADGPEMIRTIMYFSPLDDQYERELLNRFSRVSRAVVLASLLTAVVQGALAGVGFILALPGDAPIFLLIALTMITALVPFIGAIFVWLPACVWIYAYAPRVVEGEVVQGDPLTAIVLGIYCAIFVSGIDNVIKPLVLHGQSQLHPLLALLSIIGGVTVLGPVGILVGPMLVSFLQALLTMLRKELDQFSTAPFTSHELAAAVGASPVPAETPPSQARIDGQSAPETKPTPSPRKPAPARRPKRKRGR